MFQWKVSIRKLYSKLLYCFKDHPPPPPPPKKKHGHTHAHTHKNNNEDDELRGTSRGCLIIISGQRTAYGRTQFKNRPNKINKLCSSDKKAALKKIRNRKLRLLDQKTRFPIGWLPLSNVREMLFVGRKHKLKVNRNKVIVYIFLCCLCKVIVYIFLCCLCKVIVYFFLCCLCRVHLSFWRSSSKVFQIVRWTKKLKVKYYQH